MSILLYIDPSSKYYVYIVSSANKIISYSFTSERKMDAANGQGGEQQQSKPPTEILIPVKLYLCGDCSFLDEKLERVEKHCYEMHSKDYIMQIIRMGYKREFINSKN